MFKRCKLHQSILLALILPTVSFAEVEVTGYLKNETSVFTRQGQLTGEAETMLDQNGHDKGDLLKFENSARVFLNGELGEESTWHADLNFIYDSEGVNDYYKGHELYTQHDYLKELYVDTSLFGWDLRLGKQQVVWGTADGIKLLDIINPTDFRELNQNAMEDARIPIWMINAERNIGDSSNFQFIVSQVEENKIPGLNPVGDAGHPFLMKGVETISGQVNGFYSIAPALSNVAATFNAAAMGGGFTGGMQLPVGLNLFAGLTVDGFAGNFWDAATTPGLLNPTVPTDPMAAPGWLLLNAFSQFGFTGQPNFPAGLNDPNGNFGETNLMPITGLTPLSPTEVSWQPSKASSAFELMSNATFATFNTFTSFSPSTPTGLTGTTSEWVRDYPDDSDVNAGFRFRNSTDGGLNWSVNYFHHYGGNPDIDLSWRNSAGDELTVQRAPTLFFDTNGTPGPQQNDTFVPDVSTSLSRDQARANWDMGNATTILVHDGTGSTYYGALDPSAVLPALADGSPFNEPPAMGAGAPTLRFTESLHRVNSLGTSFDYALEVGDVPLVLRGEFLYDEGEKQPIIDKFLLSIGDLTNALKMEDADYFKYVLGADITVATNLLISGQFIQFRNLDFIEEKDTCVTQTGQMMDCSRYTADFPTMNLSNGLKMGYEDKEFYSLFFSKPFGDSQEHRWNNIFIYEEGGGKWNRLDVEYTFTDTVLGSVEWNNYWGDEDTTFGQFEKSSNFQVGLKWIFE
ncbi:MAG: RNA polymerase-associated protein rapA [Candidatus Thiodiazotropha sp.]|nr:RNA polymerase-associated protein rapA [Candidatus Thiodiazotropha sp.]MCM8883875.1 RNA polymerase-associated protein rapA [Candidatus Thiodiazotropha sp.]MCM8919799.1 RNA polymerase-associated protein rapA [Candidatus Thiodiazotropha sp.]